MQRGRDPERDRLGLADREGLGHLLADDDVQRGEDQEADEERDRVQRRLAQAQRPGRAGSSRAATAGSPTQPRPSEAMVIPSWQAAR